MYIPPTNIFLLDNCIREDDTDPNTAQELYYGISVDMVLTTVLVKCKPLNNANMGLEVILP